MSDLDGAGALLLFAFYFENLLADREGAVMDADAYDSVMAQVVPLIRDCLIAMEEFDPVQLNATLDSFARTVLRLKVP